MKLEFEKSQKVNLNTVDYGDVLIVADDSKWLIVRDEDGGDYRGVNLETYELTDYQSSIESLVEWELCGKVTRIIKSEDLVLGVR